MLGNYKMSLIGTQHQADENGVCQDYCDGIELKNGWIAAAIADGLGSAKKSDLGSSTAVKTVLSFIAENYPEKWHEESLISLLRTAYHKAINTIRALSQNSQDDISDYDTTLTTLVYNGTNVVFGHVGDGGIIVLSSFGDFSVLTHAQKGEAFNETSPLRAGPDVWTFGTSTEDVCAITMMTDGIFDIACPWPLAKQDQKIWIYYIRPFMDRNLLQVTTPADFENAESEIKEFFTGPYSKQITDDKTIVGIINTTVLPEIKSDDYYEDPDWETLKREYDEKLNKGQSSVDLSVNMTDAQKEEQEAEQEEERKEAQKEGDNCKSTESQTPPLSIEQKDVKQIKPDVSSSPSVGQTVPVEKDTKHLREKSRSILRSLFKK